MLQFRRRILVGVFLIFLSGVSASGQARQYACLPSGVDGSTVARMDPASSRPVTISDELHKVKARCRRGRLTDRRGRQIVFYQLKGCWGNPPAGYDRILEEQGIELARLKREKTVIELSCNPGGQPIQ